MSNHFKRLKIGVVKVGSRVSHGYGRRAGRGDLFGQYRKASIHQKARMEAKFSAVSPCRRTSASYEVQREVSMAMSSSGDGGKNVGSGELARDVPTRTPLLARMADFIGRREPTLR
jgi:hypothetical protein